MLTNLIITPQNALTNLMTTPTPQKEVLLMTIYKTPKGLVRIPVGRAMDLWDTMHYYMRQKGLVKRSSHGQQKKIKLFGHHLNLPSPLGRMLDVQKFEQLWENSHVSNVVQRLVFVWKWIMLLKVNNHLFTWTTESKDKVKLYFLLNPMMDWLNDIFSASHSGIWWNN